MRPGRLLPGNRRLWTAIVHGSCASFNEAGALPPQNTIPTTLSPIWSCFNEAGAVLPQKCYTGRLLPAAQCRFNEAGAVTPRKCLNGQLSSPDMEMLQ